MLQADLEPLFRYDLPIDQDPIRLVIDRRIPWAIHDEAFSRQLFGTGAWPDQGWKLHVSATPLSAVDILEAALDVLLAAGARFKVVVSQSRLAAVNAGAFGIPLIGKFITVYPSDDAEAVALALELDEATRGQCGPRVPTDRPLRPDSLVHYRYGAMISRPESEVAGHDAGGSYDLLDPLGRLTDDVRLPYYSPPFPDIVDPFEAAGVHVQRPPRQGLLNGRYIVSQALSRAPRGGVFRAVDVGSEPARPCLLKEAWHDVSLDAYGRDARDWAANETRILSRYGGDGVVPRCYESFELDRNLYVAIEYIDGTPLDQVLAEKHAIEDGIEPPALMAIGLATADALAHLHAIGLVFRDFKPANIVETPDGDYRLIDFGIAYEYRDQDGPPLSVGTPPFYPSEQYDGETPSPLDDIFAWGAVLYHLAGGDASFADMPKGDDSQRPFPRRPIAELRPTLPEALARLIDRAVAWDRTDRYSSMIEARHALAAAAHNLDAAAESVSVDGAQKLGATHGGSVRMNDARQPHRNGSQSALGRPSATATAPLDSAVALERARRVGDALCASAETLGEGLCWATRSEHGEQTGYNPDLYAGAAGIGLFLAELSYATGVERYADAARGAARWLVGPTWARGRAQHGLHCGEPGVAFFFLRLAKLLDMPGYIKAAELRMRRLRGAPSTTIDLIYGTAGTILGLIDLHAATREHSYLDDARAAGDALARQALQAPNGTAGCYWNVPSAAPGGPVFPYLGLLHGAAGIGLALARLATATGDQRYSDTARGAAEFLLAQAKRSKSIDPHSGDSAEALSWPVRLGDPTEGVQAHCHGAGGIAQFFVWLDRLLPDPRYGEAARGAAVTVAAQGNVEHRMGLCHGLSGAGSVLLDCYQALGDQAWLALARDIGGHVERFRDPECDGIYRMHGDGAVSPDLMSGYAGAGSFLLRLAHATYAPEPILGCFAVSS